jgi:hypothetical protein
VRALAAEVNVPSPDGAVLHAAIDKGEHFTQR